MKVLAMYLPQYHIIHENDEWWGKGYTEWTAVRNARPLFRGHVQPKVPLNSNYYDLSEETASAWKWQSDLMREYSVYGLCIYDYWFLGRQLLEKPLKVLLQHKEIKLNYCICWANESWTRTWYDKANELLVQQKYGGIDAWEEQFNYYLEYFKDERYIKIDNKPVLNIYRTAEISNLDEMRRCWDKLAKANGFDGVFIVSGRTNGPIDLRENLLDAYYCFEPGYTLKHKLTKAESFVYGLPIYIRAVYNKIFNKRHLERKVSAKLVYRAMHREISQCNIPVFNGTFPQWDNTPRRGYKGMVYLNTSPQEFQHSVCNAISLNPDAEFLYINAWNEWGEGAYLEPDEINNYQYLQSLRSALMQMNCVTTNINLE